MYWLSESNETGGEEGEEERKKKERGVSRLTLKNKRW
jgi:hypothetical protein